MKIPVKIRKIQLQQGEKGNAGRRNGENVENVEKLCKKRTDFSKLQGKTVVNEAGSFCAERRRKKFGGLDLITLLW